jgi:phenylalanyl-tRNA synthetase beta subunit
MTEAREGIISIIGNKWAIFRENIVLKLEKIDVGRIDDMIIERQGSVRNLTHIEDTLADFIRFFHAFDEVLRNDLALLIDQNVEFAQIEQIARQTEKKLLKKVELFDVYEGDKLPAGKKSYAVNFILQDEEKTMGDKQIDAIMQKLIANIKKQLNAELR